MQNPYRKHDEFSGQKVADMFNLTPQAVGEIEKKFSDKLFFFLKMGLEENKSFEEIAKQHNLHPLTPYIKYLDLQSIFLLYH